MQDKKKKQVCLIIPRFFQYDRLIKNVLEKKGFDVFIIYENVNEFSIKCKINARIYPNSMEYYNQYYISQIGDKKFDAVLAIRASTLSEVVVNYIKNKSPEANFYMYQWDSVRNNPNAQKIASKFDKVMTFDPRDARTYNWGYRPLFFTHSSLRENQRPIDIAFICSVHSKRVQIFNELKKDNNYTKYLYLYSKWSHYYKEKYLKKAIEYQNISKKDVRFKSLSQEQVNHIMGMSNVVVDYTHPDQSGLTMRTCEAIGHRCKLLTNNREVLKADFYNPNNVFVYDSDDFSIPEEFMKKPYVALSDEIYNRYSLDSWVSEILA